MFGKSRQLPGLILALFVAVCVFALAAIAQKKADEKPASATVAGCLQKSDEADVFAIFPENGKKYELVSRDIRLSAHVGHNVRATGTLVDEDEEQEQERGEGWGGKIYVTSLKLISESCK
jgi:hypothetical protein